MTNQVEPGCGPEDALDLAEEALAQAEAFIDHLTDGRRTYTLDLVKHARRVVIHLLQAQRVAQAALTPTDEEIAGCGGLK